MVNSKELTTWIQVLTVGFFVISIWNIVQTHKYRKLEYELKKSGL